MEIGIDSFAVILRDPKSGIELTPTERMANLLEEVETADAVGLDAFGVGEHYREEFLDAAPTVILGAAAARTKRIRLTSAVTVLSAADPVRVFQDFATLDLISQGRAEIIAGRGSFTEAFPLFGLDRKDYDALFAEKLDLLLKLRASSNVHWAGKYRPALTGQGIYPRPHQPELPVWLGVGGTPQSFVRAGTLGLPLMVSIISGEVHRFRPLVDLYHRAWREAGHDPARICVGLHAIGFVGETAAEAKEAFFPGWQYIFARVGAERGWPPPTRAQFEAATGPGGAYLVGDPEAVAARMREANDALGGVSRISVQMSSALLGHDAMLRSITLLGNDVAPRLR